MKAILLFALACMVLAGGCVTSRPLPAGLCTEIQSAGGVKILGAGLLADRNGLLIYGSVEREPGYFGAPFRHLDITVLGPQGDRVAEQPLKFFPDPIPTSRFGPARSTYSLRLPQAPAANSTVHVAVHCTSLSQCKLARMSR